jgi:ABC-2 type transport system permease protein
LYVLTAVPAAFRPILSLNPIVQIVQDARNVLTTIHVTSSADVLGLWAIVPYAIPFIMLGLGILIFNALSKSFAENV